MMKLILGSRAKAEAELLLAIWTDATPRYKVLLKRLYSEKPELILVRKSTDESGTADSKSNLKK